MLSKEMNIRGKKETKKRKTKWKMGVKNEFKNLLYKYIYVYIYQFFSEFNSSFLVASFLSRTASTKDTNPLKPRLCLFHIFLFDLVMISLSLTSFSLLLSLSMFGMECWSPWTRELGREGVENENKVSDFLMEFIMVHSRLDNALPKLLVYLFLFFHIT